MKKIQKTGFSPETTKNIVFGAGVLYKNFNYGEHYIQTFDTVPNLGKDYYIISGGPSGGTGYTEFKGDVFSANTKYYEKYTGYGGDKIGATKDGAKVSIIPEYTDIDVDGILVKMAGLTRKTGEKATIEATVIDLDINNIAASINGRINYSDSDPIASGSAPYISTKNDIEEGDYINNLALAARRLEDDKLTIIVFKKALCTSGFEIDTKNKETSGSKFIFEAFAEKSDHDIDTLPIEIIVERL